MNSGTSSCFGRPLQAVEACGQHKIGFGEPLDGMRPEPDYHSAPAEFKTCMMAHFFAKCARTIRKCECAGKIGESPALFQMMPVDDDPILQLSEQGRPFGFRQGRASTLAGRAGAFVQIHARSLATTQARTSR